MKVQAKKQGTLAGYQYEARGFISTDQYITRTPVRLPTGYDREAANRHFHGCWRGHSNHDSNNADPPWPDEPHTTLGLLYTLILNPLRRSLILSSECLNLSRQPALIRNFVCALYQPFDKPGISKLLNCQKDNLCLL